MILREPAYAKLNLTLDVLGTRPDGYHALRMIMQSISLRDDVELEPESQTPWQVTTDAAGLPEGEGNLAWKAAKVFYDAAGLTVAGPAIRITKRIPSCAGMAGGSSDAAAVLRLLNRHYGCPFDQVTLCDLGAQVGSDVPFCVVGGTALVEGRGEQVTPLPALRCGCFLICKPEIACQTPQIFRFYDTLPQQRHPAAEAALQAVARQDLTALALALGNSLQPAAEALYPELKQVGAQLQNSALGAIMTGSGSAYFGVYSDAETAAAAQADLPGSILAFPVPEI